MGAGAVDAQRAGSGAETDPIAQWSDLAVGGDTAVAVEESHIECEQVALGVDVAGAECVGDDGEQEPGPGIAFVGAEVTHVEQTGVECGPM